jgi:uncharacterized protein (DUF433 family)
MKTVNGVTLPKSERNPRIVSDPAVLSGKPIIRGTRVPVYIVADLAAAGYTPEAIVDDYPDLTIEDVEAAISFAAMSSDLLNSPIP